MKTKTQTLEEALKDINAPKWFILGLKLGLTFYWGNAQSAFTVTALSDKHKLKPMFERKTKGSCIVVYTDAPDADGGTENEDPRYVNFVDWLKLYNAFENRFADAEDRGKFWEDVYSRSRPSVTSFKRPPSIEYEKEWLKIVGARF